MKYHDVAIFYRYGKFPISSKLGLRAYSPILDLFILGIKKAVMVIGIYKLVVTGYTAIYRKVRMN
ncbi:MAG: hypothetical protein BWX92_03096 [Deltaproteobacteria bacterium ADurb.Bin135]|nr:MAG: hypothetical protein BWX92_03096 [Deltaproteobacteria bacterium ADurb.Bin135]